MALLSRVLAIKKPRLPTRPVNVYQRDRTWKRTLWAAALIVLGGVAAISWWNFHTFSAPTPKMSIFPQLGQFSGMPGASNFSSLGMSYVPFCITEILLIPVCLIRHP